MEKSERGALPRCDRSGRSAGLSEPEKKNDVARVRRVALIRYDIGGSELAREEAVVVQVNAVF
jgi:hypothetical protein